MYSKYISIVISLFIGFYGTYRLNYIKNPDGITSRLQELILFFDNKCFHIHHYLWLTLIIISLYIGRYIRKQLHFNMLIAFLFGCAAEGLMFKDWMLVENNCHQAMINNLFQKMDTERII